MTYKVKCKACRHDYVERVGHYPSTKPRTPMRVVDASILKVEQPAWEPDADAIMRNRFLKAQPY